MIAPVPPELGEMDAEQALACGIGYVAMSSARLDDELRWLVNLLVADGKNIDAAWILFEGQGTEWLLSAVRGILCERDPYHRVWSMELHEQLLILLAEAKKLQEKRNTVIHGTWYSAMHTPFEWEEDEVVSRKDWPKPAELPIDVLPAVGWNKVEDETLWHCHRSRLRKYKPAQELATSDVWELGENLERLASAVRATGTTLYPSDAT